MSKHNEIDNAINRFVRRHTKIGFDSNILIGLIEQSDYSGRANLVFTAFHQHNNEIWTAALTIPEVLIKPMRNRSQETVQQYEEVLFNGLINFASVNTSTARKASWLGARYRLKAGDATLLACMIEHGVTGFITADKDFKNVTDIEILLIIE